MLSHIVALRCTTLFAARLRQVRVIWCVCMKGIWSVRWGSCINDQWFNYIQFIHNLIFVISGQQPAAAVLYLGSGCFSRQGIFGGFASDRQNYCHSWCSRRTRSFESSLGCNTTTFKPSKTIQNTSKDQTFRASWGSNLKKPCSCQRKTPWHLHGFHKRCLHTLGHCGPCYPGREWALWVSWMHRAVRHRDYGPCFHSFCLVMK